MKPGQIFARKSRLNRKAAALVSLNQVPPLVAFKIAFKFSIHCVLLSILDALHTNPTQMIVSIASLLFLKNLASKYKKS